jgi:hypothetical protein
MLAGVPGQGGASWTTLQYLLGLRRLGHDVLFIEPVNTGGAPLEYTAAASYFRSLVSEFGLEGRAALIDPASGDAMGLARERLERFAQGADLLLNLSGVLRDPQLLASIDVRAYVDLDPGFTQLWHHVERIDVGLDSHNRFVTIGHGIGTAGNPVPTCGRSWITTHQPVLLKRWPVDPTPVPAALTMIGNWRGYGSIDHDGTLYGQKAHSLRTLVDLPRSLPIPVIAALGIHPDETADLQALHANSWRLVDPDTAAGTPERYQSFVSRSWAELGIAKSGYVAARCGWFSDRSICYLASGRPVIAQDTGFPTYLPTGKGLLAFDGPDTAAAAVEDLRSDYDVHRSAAREIAEEVFDSDRVLSRLLACL